MSKWTGEGEDWIQLLDHTRTARRKVMISLLKMMRQADGEEKTEKGGALEERHQEIWAPWDLRYPRATRNWCWKSEVTVQTVVD